jgi:hypothetical protein
VAFHRGAFSSSGISSSIRGISSICILFHHFL